MAGVMQFVYLTYGFFLFVSDYFCISSVTDIGKLGNVITTETQL